MKIANGMQFVNDEAVIGKWNNIGWIENTYCTSLDGLNEKAVNMIQYTFCRTVNRTGYLNAGQKAALLTYIAQLLLLMK